MTNNLQEEIRNLLREEIAKFFETDKDDYRVFYASESLTQKIDNLISKDQHD